MATLCLQSLHVPSARMRLGKTIKSSRSGTHDSATLDRHDTARRYQRFSCHSFIHSLIDAQRAQQSLMDAITHTAGATDEGTETLQHASHRDGWRAAVRSGVEDESEGRWRQARLAQ
jgi:hypothetical protein